MTGRYARVKPLGTCPHASCGLGNKSCMKLAAGKACLKTHFATHKDWQNFMFARFNEEEQWNLDAMYDALDRRIDDRRVKEPTVH